MKEVVTRTNRSPSMWLGSEIDGMFDDSLQCVECIIAPSFQVVLQFMWMHMDSNDDYCGDTINHVSYRCCY